MVAAAKTHGVHVVFGTLEPIDDKAATAYNLICMAYPDGRAPAALPPHASERPVDLYRRHRLGIPICAGDEFPVFDTVHGKVGLAMCSEVYVPEVARALALRGAELIFMPAGKDKGRCGRLAHADLGARNRESRAGRDHAEPVRPCERGLAMVAAPEEIMFESTAAA
jgi:predicted amidohydrolase